jgi:hypothetical protein
VIKVKIRVALQDRFATIQNPLFAIPWNGSAFEASPFAGLNWISRVIISHADECLILYEEINARVRKTLLINLPNIFIQARSRIN